MGVIKGCIFDLDGVIVNTARYHYLAWKRLSGELGISFTEKDNERLKGVSRMKSLDILLEIGGLSLSLDIKKHLADKKNRWYVEYISKIDRSEILPGAEDFIKAVRASGIKTGLGSASKNTMLILKNIEMMDMFDAVVDGNMVSKAKPDPEVFLLCAGNLGLAPENCVVFEDSQAGIDAAKKANMLAVGIGSPEVLKNADKTISNFQGITMDLINSIAV